MWSRVSFNQILHAIQIWWKICSSEITGHHKTSYAPSGICMQLIWALWACLKRRPINSFLWNHVCVYGGRKKKLWCPPGWKCVAGSSITTNFCTSHNNRAVAVLLCAKFCSDCFFRNRMRHAFLETGWDKNEIFTEFELWWKNSYQWNGSWWHKFYHRRCCHTDCLLYNLQE